MHCHFLALIQLILPLRFISFYYEGIIHIQFNMLNILNSTIQRLSMKRNNHLSCHYQWKLLRCSNLQGCRLTPFLAIAITDVFSWGWLVRTQQPWRSWCTVFPLSGVGWTRMFHERGGLVWWRVRLKMEEERESVCPSPLGWRGPSPSSPRQVLLIATAAVASQAKPPRLQPLAHPLRLGCEAFTLLAGVISLWPKQNHGGRPASLSEKDSWPHSWGKFSSEGAQGKSGV